MAFLFQASKFGSQTEQSKLTPEFNSLYNQLLARFSGDRNKLFSFVQETQAKYQALTCDSKGNQLTAKQAGLSESAFLYGLIAFENSRGKPINLPPNAPKGKTKPAFSQDRFIIQDLDMAGLGSAQKSSVFLVNLSSSKIEIASPSVLSPESMPKRQKTGQFEQVVGQTGQTQGYGVFALWGVRREGFSAYLYGQEPENKLIGNNIPKRFHLGNGGSMPNFMKTTAKGCIIVPFEDYTKYQSNTNNFKDALMLYAHTTVAYDTKLGKGSTAFFNYSKQSNRMNLDFIGQSMNIASLPQYLPDGFR